MDTLEQLVELMRGQTIIKGNKRQIKFKFKYWFQFVRANKENPTLFHVQITSPKYCTLKLVPLVTCD